jgi:CheY-like chemotaxis protein
LDDFKAMNQTDILLVDDDPVVRTLLGDFLKALGYNITEATGGVECLLKLRAKLPEVLVLDLQMPDMSGLEVLKTLNKGKSRPTFPIILLSANSDIKQLAEKEGVHADIYLQKPFDMQTVKNALAKCMAKSDWK